MPKIDVLSQCGVGFPIWTSEGVCPLVDRNGGASPLVDRSGGVCPLVTITTPPNETKGCGLVTLVCMIIMEATVVATLRRVASVLSV